jgi:hypothetical protein
MSLLFPLLFPLLFGEKVMDINNLTKNHFFLRARQAPWRKGPGGAGAAWPAPACAAPAESCLLGLGF